MDSEQTVAKTESSPKEEQQYVSKAQFDELVKKLDELTNKTVSLDKRKPQVRNDDQHFGNSQKEEEPTQQLPTIEEAHKIEQEQLLQKRQANQHAILTNDKYATIPTGENIRFWKENTIIEFYEANKEKLKGFDCSAVEALKKCDYDYIARSMMYKNQRYQELVKEAFPNTDLADKVDSDFAYNKVKNDYLATEMKFLRYK